MGPDPNHVQDRYPLSHTHHETDACIHSLDNGLGCIGGWYEDHTGVRLGLLHSLRHSIENRNPKMRRTALSLADTADDRSPA